MRKLTIVTADKDIQFEISDDAAKKFIEQDVLYECGDEFPEHDLHLNPEKKFSHMDVEAILEAIQGEEYDIT